MTAGELRQIHQGEAFSLEPGEPPLPGGAAEVVRFFMDVPQPIQIGGVFLGAIAVAAVAFLGWKHRVKLREWLRAIPAPVKVTALLVLLVGGTVAAVAGYRVYDFVEHDNRFCTGCHVMADAFVRFEESAHNELGCKDCHAQPKTESARQLLIWVTERPMEVGTHSPVPDVRCATCHVEQDAERWPQIAASVGHRVHFDSDDPDLSGLMCVGCHGVTVHEFIPVSATCGECHTEESQVRLGTMAGETELHCVVCHDFLGQERVTLPGAQEGMAMLPDRSRCLSCHEMANLFEQSAFDEDPHGAVCGACHNPHVQEVPAAAVATCTDCHSRPDTLTVFHTGTHAPVLSECTACHSAHTWRVDGADCVACHGAIPDQPRAEESARSGGSGRPVGSGAPRASVWAGERARSGGSASSGSRAMAAASFTSLVGMGADAVPVPWAALVLHPSPPVQERRPFRHVSHQGLSCIQCHGQPGEHGVVRVQTARECAACHHDPARSYECASCHGPDHIPVERTVTAAMDLTVREEVLTRALTFRHELHEGVSCQECHSGQVLLEVEKGCADCHSDHHRPQAECATCHIPAPEGTHGLQSHLTCAGSGCHSSATVDRPAPSRTLCLMCHQDQLDHEPGLECRNCHMIPEPPPLRAEREAV